MCGRAYETYTDEELAIRYLNKKRVRLPGGKMTPNYNMCPTQTSPIVLIRDGKLVFDRFRWGLVPFWAKDIKAADKYSLINAKSEEITEKRSYKSAFEKRRCIVPLSGFYEWLRHERGPKRPFAIYLKKQKIMSVAGIWEHWQSKETKEKVDSFSILTTAANGFMDWIHTRMPVILPPDKEQEWLDPENHNVEALKKLLKPCPSSWLMAYEIAPTINSPKNNRKEVLDPIA
jgi:putative SOS response-associated peptidase YedK